MSADANKSVENVVKKSLDTLTKDLPNLLKENKGAAVGGILGYFLADTLSKHEGVLPAVVGALVGSKVDEKNKKDVF